VEAAARRVFDGLPMLDTDAEVLWPLRRVWGFESGLSVVDSWLATHDGPVELSRSAAGVRMGCRHGSFAGIGEDDRPVLMVDTAALLRNRPYVDRVDRGEGSWRVTPAVLLISVPLPHRMGRRLVWIRVGRGVWFAGHG
jgi:hypothetical protein